jgi:SNF2 family DNA or RNA helicase
MVQGTLEERIETLLANKRKMADQIVDAAGAGAHQWTRDELMELLKPLD